MTVLGVVTVNVDKSFVQPHAAQLAQLAMDVFREQYVVDRDRREPVSAVKVERLTGHMLAVGRAADRGIVTSASAGAVDVHGHVQYFADMLDQL